MTTKARLTLKTFLSDGTKLSKVIYFDTAKPKQEAAILSEISMFLDNMFLRYLTPDKKK